MTDSSDPSGLYISNTADEKYRSLNNRFDAIPYLCSFRFQLWRESDLSKTVQRYPVRSKRKLMKHTKDHYSENMQMNHSCGEACQSLKAFRKTFQTWQLLMNVTTVESRKVRLVSKYFSFKRLARPVIRYHGSHV